MPRHDRAIDLAADYVGDIGSVERDRVRAGRSSVLDRETERIGPAGDNRAIGRRRGDRADRFPVDQIGFTGVQLQVIRGVRDAGKIKCGKPPVRREVRAMAEGRIGHQGVFALIERAEIQGQDVARAGGVECADDGEFVVIPRADAERQFAVRAEGYGVVMAGGADAQRRHRRIGIAGRENCQDGPGFTGEGQRVIGRQADGSGATQRRAGGDAVGNGNVAQTRIRPVNIEGSGVNRGGPGVGVIAGQEQDTAALYGHRLDGVVEGDEVGRDGEVYAGIKAAGNRRGGDVKGRRRLNADASAADHRGRRRGVGRNGGGVAGAEERVVPALGVAVVSQSGDQGAAGERQIGQCDAVAGCPQIGDRSAANGDRSRGRVVPIAERIRFSADQSAAGLNRGGTRTEGGIAGVEAAGNFNRSINSQTAGVGVIAGQQQRSCAGLADAVAAGDYAPDGERASRDGDRRVSSKRDGARAEIQAAGPAEGEAAVPVLSDVVAEGDGVAGRVIEVSARDREVARADRGGAIDIERAGVEDSATAISIRVGENQGAGAGCHGQYSAGAPAEEAGLGESHSAGDVKGIGAGVQCNRSAAGNVARRVQCAAGQCDPAGRAEVAVAGDAERAGINDRPAGVGIEPGENQGAGAGRHGQRRSGQ